MDGDKKGANGTTVAGEDSGKSAPKQHRLGWGTRTRFKASFVWLGQPSGASRSAIAQVADGILDSLSFVSPYDRTRCQKTLDSWTGV